jgi:hypothetical protein
MSRRFTTSLSVVAGIVVVSFAGAAFASDPTCLPMKVKVGSAVSTWWPDLLEKVRGALEGRDDIDACANVELSQVGNFLLVRVILPDGRSAGRSVSRREDVLPTLEALLLVPHEAATVASAPQPDAPAPSTAATPTNELRVSVPPMTSDREPTAPRLAMSPPSRLRIELSAITDARIGDGQTSLGLGATSFLDVAGWLVGFEGRADRYWQLAGGRAGASLELAILGGRRFRFGDMSLDLSVGPAVALRGTASTTVTTPTGTTTSQSNEGTVPRLQLGAHLHFAAHSTVRPFVGLDGDFGPSRSLGAEPTIYAPDLPIWTAGLALGATVGTQ